MYTATGRHGANPTASASATGRSASRKDTARAWVEDHRGDLSAWTRAIWDLAEPAWREYRSAAWYVDRLRAEGFEVEEGSGGMPTAFSADVDAGRAAPTLLTYAEYDAVPGNCQAASTDATPPRRARRASPPATPTRTRRWASARSARLLGTKRPWSATASRGTLRYTGEPAEKVQGSKVVHGLRGYYDGVDAIVSFHPFYMLPLCNTVRWDTHCGAYYSRVYSFVCDEPRDWPPSAEPNWPDPGVALGRPRARARTWR